MDLHYSAVYQNLLNKREVSEKDYKDFLNYASDNYYTQDSVISDQEFDIFRTEFKNNFNYDAVSIGTSESLSKGFTKANHGIPMGSLVEFDTNKDVTEEVYKYVNKYAEENILCTSEKLDGLSVSIEYSGGELTQALTRGDGFEGDDITSNVIKMRGVKTTLPVSFSGFVRGEIALRKSIKLKHFSGFKNERAAAIGITKRKNGEGCEHLDIFSYKIYPNKDQSIYFQSEYEAIEYIKNILQLQTPRFYKTNTKTLIALHKKYEEETREKLDYLIDGLVVNIDSIEQQIKITENILLPEYARKYKFEVEKAYTELIEVRNQVGRTGAITPLAILEPVACGGTTISKATLHNYDEISRLKIKVGDIITVVRSKDVIPKIIGIHEKGEDRYDIVPPEKCPECESILDKKDTVFYCVNENCGGRLSKSLLHWLNILNLKNMGDKVVNALINSGKLKSIPDYYKLKLEDISTLDRQGQRSATKMIQEIRSKKEITISELLAGLNIKNLSVKRTEILEDNFNTLDRILDIKIKDIVAIEGFEEKLATDIYTGLKQKTVLIKEILEHIKLKEKPKGELSEKSFCFSGFRDNDLEEEIKNKGGRIASSVNKKLDYLVVKNKNSTTSKIEKARKYGTNIIEPEDLDGLLHNLLF